MQEALGCATHGVLVKNVKEKLLWWLDAAKSELQTCSYHSPGELSSYKWEIKPVKAVIFVIIKLFSGGKELAE